MKLTAVDWKRLSGLLDRAMDLKPEQRRPWLDSLDESHSDLRAALGEILFGGDGPETGDFLQALPQFSTVSGTGSLTASEVAAGDIVGAYRLRRELGSGGTASVWLAERADGSLQRQFALKFPHVGHVDRGLAERMARERDILTSLDHPNIARLYDAGLDDKGRPYLALEFVDGISPDEYCRRHACSLRQRLELFLQVARAVAYAHARLVVHRDLKPNNILVTEAGEVRLLDFGIARLLEGDRAAAAFQTQVGIRALTPAYAAPEQFLGQPITVASDVYSLGVVLFELLTGRSPYSPKRPTLSAIEQAVLEAAVPAASSVAPGGGARALRGDIDNILLKALAKLPRERYGTVDAFAADVERHLTGLPIAARRASAWYVTGKFVRRHVAGLSVAALVAAAVVASSAVAFWQWRAAERQNAVAMSRLGDARAAADFSSAVLTEGLQADEQLTTVALLARSEVLAERMGRRNFRIRAVAAAMVARWYRDFEMHADAIRVLTGAIDSLPSSEGGLAAPLICSRFNSYSQAGRKVDDGIAEFLRALPAAQDAADRAHCLASRAGLAWAKGDTAGVVDYARQALQTFEGSGVVSPLDEANLAMLLGAAYAYDNQIDAGLEYLARAREAIERAGRAESRLMFDLYSRRATAWLYAGNPLRTRRELEAGYALSARLAPPGRQVLDGAIALRAGNLEQLAQYEESKKLWALAYASATENKNPYLATYAASGQASLALTRGQLESARRYLAIAEQSSRNTDVLSTQLGVKRGRARLAAAEGRLPEAYALFTELIDAPLMNKCCEGMAARMLTGRSEVALRQGRTDAAWADASRALRLARHVQGKQPYSYFTALALGAQARIHAVRGRHSEAAVAFASAGRHFAETAGQEHPEALASFTAAGREARFAP